MIPSVLAKRLFASYPTYRLDHLTPRNCKHAEIRNELMELVAASNGMFTLHELGMSLEGRSIHLLTCGRGAKTVLLWSQMHGDEATATLALMDMFNFLVNRETSETWVEELLDEVKLYFIPMVNPDGAERRQRRTAQGIDMNRDARSLATPEARILRRAQAKLKPAFGFNLHDQELSRVGNSKAVTAIALLAPALDARKSTPLVRLRATRLAAFIARILNGFVDGHLATYNDEFEPRAFGDNMQAWGTSTVLIESGHWPNDSEKNFVRKLNYVAILSALRGIGSGSYQDVDLDHYLHLPMNGRTIYDIIIREVRLTHPSGWSELVDIGLKIDPARNRDAQPLIVTIDDVGDLATYEGLEIIPGQKRAVSSEDILIGREVVIQELLSKLQLYHPA